MVRDREASYRSRGEVKIIDRPEARGLREVIWRPPGARRGCGEKEITTRHAQGMLPIDVLFHAPARSDVLSGR